MTTLFKADSFLVRSHKKIRARVLSHTITVVESEDGFLANLPFGSTLSASTRDQAIDLAIAGLVHQGWTLDHAEAAEAANAQADVRAGKNFRLTAQRCE